MNNDFYKLMSQKSDLELIKITTIFRDQYDPSALEAAEKEIANRHMDATRIEELRAMADAEYANERDAIPDYALAGKMNRLAHYVVDNIAIYMITLILSIIVGMFYETSDEKVFTRVVTLIYLVCFFAYYIFMEFRFQKTIGKMMTNTRVVNKDGTKPALGDIAKRTLCRIIPFESVSFVFSGNGFHDNLSDTTVIKDDMRHKRP